MQEDKASVRTPPRSLATRSSWSRCNTLAAVAVVLTLPGFRSASAQRLPPDAQAKPPEFDAASIKPQRDQSVNLFMNTKPSGLSARKVTMKLVIAYAYGFRRDRVIGGPAWLDSNEYDVVARTNQADVPMATVDAMIRTMLADRLQLRVHRESQPHDVYALAVARRDGRLGPSLTRSAGCEQGTVVAVTPSRGNRINLACETRSFVEKGSASVEARGKPIGDLVRALQGTAGRPVVDKTGLRGFFDFDLRYRPQIGPDDPIEPGDVPELFTALREQLGLTLRPERGAVEVLVIDDVQLPTPD